MVRRFSARVIGALAAVAALTAWAGMPPNILWIVSADHSWRHAAVYGDPNARTPNLDRLPYWPVDFFNQPFWLELAKQNEAGTLDPKRRSFYFAPQRPVFELYDLANDPHELHNLAGKPDAVREEFRLKMALTEWMLTERDYLPLPAPDAPKER